MAITGRLAQKNNKWYCVLNLYDENHQRKQKWFTTNYPVKGNKKKAEKVLQAKIAEYESKHLEYYTDITVADYFQLWLTKIKGEVRQNTYRTYKGNMDNHIIPYFASKKIMLQLLTPKDITAYYQFKHESSELSGRTLKHHHQNISKALADAVEVGYITFNPAAMAKTIKDEDYVAEFLNESQMRQVKDMFNGTPVSLAVELCCIYGFRRSEVLGLKWRNVDFENGTIRICETLQQSTKAITGESNYIDRTKTKSSTRALPMTNRARELLLEQLKRQEHLCQLLGSSYTVSDYVCTFDDGKVISPNYLTRTFHQGIVKSELPQIRLHDLRHSVASNLLARGFSVVQVAEWLGHSTSATTLKFYAHADKTSKMAIANALNSI